MKSEVREDEQDESLVAQVLRMLAREAYHYCADCHTHCKQTILTVEALKESVREVAALTLDRDALLAFVREFVRHGCHHSCERGNCSHVGNVRLVNAEALLNGR